MRRHGDEERARALEAAIGGATREGGVVSADAAARLVAELGLTDVRALMVALLPHAARRARTPVSAYPVGAVARGSTSGALYLGANLEIARVALAFTVHAEQAATSQAWLHGEAGLDAIAVTAAPCGHCRQFLHELATADRLEVTIARAGAAPTTRPLAAYLPDAFGPSDLGVGAALMSSGDAGLAIDTDDPLSRAALAAANASYAPYTGNHAGVALLTADGAVFSGRLAENAAYNPGLSPLASALVAATMGTTHDERVASVIARAVLVERVTRTSQHAAAQVALAAVSPGVRLEHLRAS